MPKDYNRPRKRSGRRRQQHSGWLWFLSGFIVGTAATLIVTFQDFFSAEEVASAMRKATSEAGLSDSSSKSKDTQEGKRRPRFEFYTMLPEMEVAVPEHELTRAGKPSGGGGGSEVTRYVLQAGSFRRLGEADRLKAELALLGMQAKIQTVAIDGENKWHRVRVGPFTNVQALNEARSTLKNNGVEVMVLKIKS